MRLIRPLDPSRRHPGRRAGPPRRCKTPRRRGGHPWCAEGGVTARDSGTPPCVSRARGEGVDVTDINLAPAPRPRPFARGVARGRPAPPRGWMGPPRPEEPRRARPPIRLLSGAARGASPRAYRVGGGPSTPRGPAARAEESVDSPSREAQRAATRHVLGGGSPIRVRASSDDREGGGAGGDAANRAWREGARTRGRENEASDPATACMSGGAGGEVCARARHVSAEVDNHHTDVATTSAQRTLKARRPAC